MDFHRNKKSLVKGFIIGILLTTASFILILAILNVFRGEAEEKTTEAICRGSVVLREKSYTEIKEQVTPLKASFGSVATPLLCKTIDKYIPEDKEASKEDIEREVAKIMTSCWREFGEGLIQDVFKEGDALYKNCFTCYTLSLRETSKFKGEIKSTELLDYLFQSPYKVSPKDDSCRVNGGFCIPTENREDCMNKLTANPSYILIDKDNGACKKDGKKGCCYTEYECWNRGGTCRATNPDESSLREYKDWECPTDLKCFVKKEDYYSYGDYIQKSGGNGNIIITTDLNPGETYAISFGSPTGQCAWCTDAGIGGGAGAAAAIALAGGPAGWALFGGVGVYTVIKGFTGSIAEDFNNIFNRKMNTVYLTTLNQIREGRHCSIVSDIRE